MRGLGTILSRVMLPTVAALVALPAPVEAQDGGGEPPDLSVSDFAWLEGTWRGPGPDGTVAEIHYMGPSAGVLPAAFRLVRGERVVVLEFVTLTEEEDGLYMYVRHFSPALEPMEKGHPITLRLVGREGDRFAFENVLEGNPTVAFLTRTGPDAVVSMSELARPDGSTDTIRVEYERVRPDASTEDASRQPSFSDAPLSRAQAPPGPEGVPPCDS